jgi:regulator of cell morphogenesis and NO signaling
MTTQTITQYFESDHDRLDQLLKQYDQMKRSDFATAKPFFREFKFGLQRHIIWEEEVLFPAYEQKTGFAGTGPSLVMRKEHRLIEQLLENVHQKVKHADPESDEEEQLLINTLLQHNLKEENILYPAIDNLLTPDERAEIFRNMDEIPEERYRACCHGK